MFVDNQGDILLLHAPNLILWEKVFDIVVVLGREEFPHVSNILLIFSNSFLP